MKNNKKGTALRTTSYLYNCINRVENACIAFFVVFLIMVIVGVYIGNERLESIGIGIGVAVATIQMLLNTAVEEGDDDDVNEETV